MEFFITIFIGSILGLALCFYVQGKKFYKFVREIEEAEKLYRTRRAVILTTPHTMK